MVAVTSAPYLYALLRTPEGYQFSWVIHPYPEDAYSYMAWARQAVQGSWLFSVKYTLADHAPFLFHPFFLIAGIVSKLTGFGLGPVFLVLKAVGVAVFFLLLFRLFDALKLTHLEEVCASAFIGLSAGVGAILYATVGEGLLSEVFIKPVDVWLVDSNTFWSFVISPLHPWSLSLVVASVLLMIRSTERRCVKTAVGSGLCIGVLVLVHPYLAPLLLLLFGVHSLTCSGRRGVRLWFAAVASCAPFLVYPLTLSLGHEQVIRHAARGVMSSPDPLSLVAGMGLPLVLAIWGVAMIRGLGLRFRLLLMWAGLALIFAYVPVWFRMKFLLGIGIPIGIVGGVAFAHVVKPFYEKANRMVVTVASLGLLALLFSSNAYLLKSYASPSGELKHDFDLYLSRDLMSALEYLQESSEPDDVVFATVRTSTLVPAISGNRVIWGHWAQSGGLNQFGQWQTDLFSNDSTVSREERSRRFWEKGFKYVLIDRRMRDSIAKGDFAWLIEELEDVFVGGDVRVAKKRPISRAAQSADQ